MQLAPVVINTLEDDEEEIFAMLVNDLAYNLCHVSDELKICSWLLVYAHALL